MSEINNFKYVVNIANDLSSFRKVQRTINNILKSDGYKSITERDEFLKVAGCSDMIPVENRRIKEIDKNNRNKVLITLNTSCRDNN